MPKLIMAGIGGQRIGGGNAEECALPRLAEVRRRIALNLTTTTHPISVMAGQLSRPSIYSAITRRAPCMGRSNGNFDRIDRPVT